jgi:signal transduction histidine kinase
MRRVRRSVFAAAVVVGSVGTVALAQPAGAGPAPPPPPTLLPPLSPIVEGLLNTVGNTVGGVADALDGPTAAPSSAPPATAATTPGPEAALPAPAPPGGVDPVDPDETEAPGTPPSTEAAEGDGDTGSAFLPVRIGRAVTTKTSLLLLGLGLGVALLGATPRLPAHRRARREVLSRLADACERERRAAHALAAADRSKGEFLGLVSQELRAPLTTMRSSVDTVLVDWDEMPEERRLLLLTRASGKANELARLVGELLAFARIDGGHVDFDVRALPVDVTIQRTLRSIEGILADQPVEVDVPDGLFMRADAETFTHVLGGLVTNAAKCSRPHAPVRVIARSRNGDVIVSVTTTEVQDDSNGGSGIGLAVARRFTEVQGGRMWVEGSRRSSTCAFSIPAVTPAEAQPVYS